MPPRPQLSFRFRPARPSRRMGSFGRVRVRGARSRGVKRMKDVPPTPFLVGRISRDGKTTMVLDPAVPPPIPGPWDLRAVYSL